MAGIVHEAGGQRSRWTHGVASGVAFSHARQWSFGERMPDRRASSCERSAYHRQPALCGFEEPPMFAHFIVPTDGSRLSDKALAHAAELAKATGGRITVFHVSPTFPVTIYADGMTLDLMSRREYAK